MKHLPRTTALSTLFTLSTLFGFTSALLPSCTPPPEKPIPPLKPPPTQKPKPTPPTTRQSSPATITSINVGDLFQLVQNNAALIIDVRPTLYFKMSHIPGAVSWPQKNFAADYEKQAPSIRNANANNTPVILYCTDLACPDALNVANQLARRGHSISVLEGGYEAWKLTTQ